MRLAMPFVWDERCLAHDPRSEVWVGVATPAAETSSRIEAIRASLLEAQAPQVDNCSARSGASAMKDSKERCVDAGASPTARPHGCRRVGEDLSLPCPRLEDLPR